MSFPHTPESAYCLFYFTYFRNVLFGYCCCLDTKTHHRTHHRQIKPLDEGKAIADGGDLLAEGFIYALGAGLRKSSGRAMTLAFVTVSLCRGRGLFPYSVTKARPDTSCQTHELFLVIYCSRSPSAIVCGYRDRSRLLHFSG